jgi:twitching motility protein PilT
VKRTVDDLCEQIERLHLMSSEDTAALKARWFQPGRKEVQDAGRFCEWLRANDYVTEFVLSAVCSGKSARLTLNQYRLTDQLRSGGEAGDFLATDPLDHVVRVAIVAPAVAQDAALFATFRHVAQRLMSLAHPNVARVLDLGEAHGVDYLVSEHVEGETLEDVLQKRGKLNPQLAARIFAVVLEGVQALHHHGVPAGDLSADCLVFASVEKSAGATRTVRLVNAGLPRRFFDSSALGIAGNGHPAGAPRGSGLTQGDSEFDGTPRPEDDLYRVGVLLHRCVTGQAPSAGDGAHQPGRALRPMTPDVPEMLADLIGRLTDPELANRLKSAAGAAKALRVFLRTEEERQAGVEEKIAVAVPSHPPAGHVPERDGEDGEQPDDASAPVGDLPVPAAVPGEPEINRLFRAVIHHEASDLHLCVECPPMMRLRNAIRRTDQPPLGAEDMERLVEPILSERSRSLLEAKGGADFAHVVGKGEGRFRVNLFKQQGHLGLVARRVNAKVPTFEKLGLPPVIEKLCLFDQGLVILAGVTGSGKSTTLAAMLDYINEHEEVHILTIEDPIEYLFRRKKAIINQREVGIDVVDWATALKHAVREDPDVILIGEMRDRDTFEAGLNAAETGHLVFGTIHASSAPSTIGRILDLFPADMHPAMRQSLAFNLKAIVCQKLLPGLKPGVARVPANEIMIVNPTVRDLIVKGEDKKLPDAIRIGLIEGMLDFNESLRQLVTRGDVDRDAALAAAPNPDALKMALKGIKVAQPGIL